jgi:hypothetical protein
LIWIVSIGVAVVLLGLTVWLYPVFYRYLQKQDCIAQGYTSCGP